MRAWPLVALLLAACAPVLAGECKPPNLEEACVTALKNAKKTLDNTDATPDEKDAAADLILSYKNLVGGARIFENAYRRREGPGPMEDDFAKTVAKAQDYRDQHPTTAKTEPRNTVTPTGDPVTMGKLRYSELNTLLDPNPKAGEEKLDNRGGGTPEERNELGDEYAARGDPTGARRNYEKSLKLDPNNGETYSKLAQLKYQQGDGAGAVADAKKALALDPKNQLALLIAGHGDSISQGGSRIKFKADFGAVRDPDAALPPASGAGKNASAPGAGASSRAPAPTQAQVMPSESPGLRSPAEVLELRARERLRMKDYTGAVMAARQAVDLEPNRAKGWALLAESSNEAGNPKGALEAAKKALDLDPANAQALRAKAYAEYLLGDFRQAYVDALRAVTLEPQNGLGYLYLAMAEEKLGHTADALKHYEQAVALDTTLDPLAQEARKRLGGGSSSSLSPDARKHMVRGGAIAGSLILILLGLLGTAAGKQLTTTAKRLIAATESDQATVLEGPAPSGLEQSSEATTASPASSAAGAWGSSTTPSTRPSSAGSRSSSSAATAARPRTTWTAS
ncbi:MAG: tetratricopeptide repeat protein [Elusimicrobia bacterium]|nr:tetratricopeptide repeat protein [Elusimicrobiota bacterium]